MRLSLSVRRRQSRILRRITNLGAACIWGGFILNRFDTESYVRDVRSPLLVMHSELDEIVPLSCSDRIMSSANEPKRFQLLPGAPHNGADLYATEIYYAAIEGFLREFTAWS